MDNNKQKTVCPKRQLKCTHRLCRHLDGNVVQSTITTTLSLKVDKQRLVVIHHFNGFILLKKNRAIIDGKIGS